MLPPDPHRATILLVEDETPSAVARLPRAASGSQLEAATPEEALRWSHSRYHPRMLRTDVVMRDQRPEGQRPRNLPYLIVRQVGVSGDPWGHPPATVDAVIASVHDGR